MTIRIPHLLIVATYAISLNAQTPAPHFEVASVKKVDREEYRAKGASPPRGLKNDAEFKLFASLQIFIHQAYKLQYYEHIAGPGWMILTTYEIQAKLPAGAHKDQIPEMLQSLLKDRFAFAAHQESIEQPVYTLTVAKTGLKLKQASPNAGPHSGWKPKGVQFSGSSAMAYTHKDGVIYLESPKMPMPLLAQLLSQDAGLPVVDQTGLTGYYEVAVAIPGKRFSRERAVASSAGAASDAAEPMGVDLTKSVAPLGLKLEKGKSAVQQLIVDHVNMTPTKN